MSGIGTHGSSRGLLQARPDLAKSWVSNAMKLHGHVDSVGSETSSFARSSALSSHPRGPPNASKVSNPVGEQAISPQIGSKFCGRKQNDPEIKTPTHITSGLRVFRMVGGKST